MTSELILGLVVILGGLFTSTLLNLFFVPPLYLRFAKARSQRGTPPVGERKPGAPPPPQPATA